MKIYLTLTFLLLTRIGSSIAGGDVIIEFMPNTPATAADVNANFALLESRLNTLQAALTAANQTINTLESELDAIADNSVLSLDGYLSLSTFNNEDTALFDSINVQIVNGTGDTLEKNQLGNLILGYNENLGNAYFFCQNHIYTIEPDCINNGGIWSQYNFSGSHNLILGRDNSFDNNSSIVAGESNVSNWNFASILGGQNNYAFGKYSSILGGKSNRTSGENSSVSGGAVNLAGGENSSVSGGHLTSALDINNWAAGNLFQSN